MNIYFILGMIFTVLALIFGIIAVKYSNKYMMRKANCFLTLMWISIAMMWIFFTV